MFSGDERLRARLRVGARRDQAGSARLETWHRRLKMTTGLPVVGRRTPAGLTLRPTSGLTSVDLPAPVDRPAMRKGVRNG